ncbi:hypothetical protein AAF712_010985 [Marasmius tenuissimus]|uniref:Uncharacterized protein n=1 Tax=Marasmius tenuissimus TaxID=585030 RepID=A0ABR2ZLB0_9AGAR
MTSDIPHIPDDITIPQFIFGTHPIRPECPSSAPWLIDDDSDISYTGEEAKKRALTLSSAFQKRFSLKPDDAVVLLTDNHIDYPICIWAVQQFLGVVAPTNPAFTVSELTTHLGIIKPSLLIAQSENILTVEKAAHNVGIPLDRIITIDKNAKSYTTISQLLEEGQSLPSPPEIKLSPGEGKERIAFLNASSGTTGPPKVIQISHHSVIANVLLTAVHNKIHLDYTTWDEKRYRVGDSCLAILPLYHIYGLDLVLHFNIFAGVSVVVVPKFNFAKTLSSISRYRITHLMIVPPQGVLLCKDPKAKNSDLSSLRVILCASSALPRDLYDLLCQTFPSAHIGQAYGATEITGVGSMCPIADKQNPYCGTLIPGVIGRVIRPDGSEASPGSGYLGNDDATRETFLEDGWIRSGDIVKIDAAGNIDIVDRVKVKGYQVAPAELEATIIENPLVDDVCVVGMPDTYSGELPLAFVVPSQLARSRESEGERVKKEIMERVAQNKSKFKHLARVEFIEAVPRTPSGKLLRRDLRERAKKLVGASAKL